MTLTSLFEAAEMLVVVQHDFKIKAVCGTVIDSREGSPNNVHPNPTSSERFKEMIRDAKSRCLGLCIDCVASGGKKGKCRIKHD